MYECMEWELPRTTSIAHKFYDHPPHQIIECEWNRRRLHITSMPAEFMCMVCGLVESIDRFL